MARLEEDGAARRVRRRGQSRLAGDLRRRGADLDRVRRVRHRRGRGDRGHRQGERRLGERCDGSTTVPWITLTDLAEVDRFAVPAPNATDVSTIAAQERRLLRKPCRARPAYCRDPVADRVVRAGGRRERASARGVLVGRPPQAASARAWRAMPGRRVAPEDRKTPLAHPGRSQAVLDVGDSVGRE